MELAPEDGTLKVNVAIIHYWLLNMRGGERVVEALCRIFPQADIYTHVYDKAALSETLLRHNITATSLSNWPLANKLYQSYLPLMPGALESLDLSKYDLVISSESGPSKGVIAPPNAPHLCYCHSPMRYLWDQYHTYRNGAGFAAKLAMPLLAPSLRQWDVTSAARVDAIISNSSHVAKRVNKYWRRNTQVIHPPVAVQEFSAVHPSELQSYYLWAGELVTYKRPDLMIEAFNKNGKPLVIIGGPDKVRKALQSKAKDNITFLGKVDFATLKHYMARCKALIFPGEEDFGIVPVEVMASGRPVIAFGKGGALETVIEGKTGMFFHEQTAESLNTVITRFEAEFDGNFNPADLIAHASNFSEQAFRTAMLKEFQKLGIDIPKNMAAIGS